MRGTKAKAIRRLAKSTRPGMNDTRYHTEDGKTVKVVPFCLRGVYQKLKREVKSG